MDNNFKRNTSDIKCSTKSCIDIIKKYGEKYHDVFNIKNPPDFFKTAVAQCQRCGGYTDGKKWVHQCVVCGSNVEPGELKGLFVPHKCTKCAKELADNERARGAVCRMCNKPYSLCCC